MRTTSLVGAFAFSLAVGLVGVPTTLYTPLDVDAIHSSNDVAAGHMGGGHHIVVLGSSAYGIDTTGYELNPDPCAVQFGDNWKTDGIYQGDGSVVSILDKYHDCEWNPFN